MSDSKTQSFAQELRHQRQFAKMSQNELAERIHTDVKSVMRWESGKSLPRPYMLENLRRVLPALIFDRVLETSESLLEISHIHIRIMEDPLSAQNLLTILSALIELSTKYWLIAKGRFSDLIEYTQTHNDQFAEEAQIVITHISYNSPFNMEWKVDLSAPSVAEALVTTIDGITQRHERLDKAKLENQAKSLEIREVEQKVEQENQIALLEQEKHRLEIEQRRLEVLEKQLEVQKKSIEYALEIAGKVIDTLHAGVDPATRAMEIQALLPNLIQLQSGKGLELAFPLLPK